MTDQLGQGDTLRAAQIEAVREALDAAEYGRQDNETLAGHLVDAVLAASEPHIMFDYARNVTPEQAQEFERRFREIMAQPQRIAILPGPTPDALDQAEARGYAAAVANLRDTATYKRWHQQVYATTGVDHHRWNWNNRVTLADYLEAVGPGAGGTRVELNGVDITDMIAVDRLPGDSNG